MRYLIKKYATTKYERLIKKYKKIHIKLDKHYTHDLNVKRVKLFNKIMRFKENWKRCIYEI